MTNFMDGPAKGVRLSLAYAPLFLRVVKSADGAWDALDLPSDVPEPDEIVYVYKRCSDPATCFVDGRDPKTGKRFGRRLSAANYVVLVESEPSLEVKRNAEKWQAWIDQQTV